MVRVVAARGGPEGFSVVGEAAGRRGHASTPSGIRRATGILESMSNKKHTPRRGGRLKQIWQVFTVTVRNDRMSLLWILLALVLPIAAGIALALLLSRHSVLGIVLWVLFGVLTGVLLALTVLGRRAEAMAYSRIEGEPGAVGAVLRTELQRSWQGSEMPVAVNARTRDAVYRMVGRPGAVLVGEGDSHRLKRLFDEEQVRIRRVVPNVAVHRIVVGDGEDGTVRLRRVSRQLARLKPVLTKAEVAAVNDRLISLERTTGPGIPKGMDPNRLRPSHKGLR